MAFFISYPSSALNHDISPRTDWYQVLLVAWANHITTHNS